METNLLNQPLSLPNGSVLRNRLAKAAMSETLGTYGNRPTEALVRLYRCWGASGLGLIITGNVMIDINIKFGLDSAAVGRRANESQQSAGTGQSGACRPDSFPAVP